MINDMDFPMKVSDSYKKSLASDPKGGFPLSRNFSVCMRVDKTEGMYGRSRENVCSCRTLTELKRGKSKPGLIV